MRSYNSGVAEGTRTGVPYSKQPLTLLWLPPRDKSGDEVCGVRKFRAATSRDCEISRFPVRKRNRGGAGDGSVVKSPGYYSRSENLGSFPGTHKAVHNCL